MICDVLVQRFTEDELDFQKKILYRSGLGNETYVPPCAYPCAPARGVIMPPTHDAQQLVVATTDCHLLLLPHRFGAHVLRAVQGSTPSPSTLTMRMRAKNLK